MTENKRSTTVASLKRGLEVLAAIAVADEPIGITELSRQMALAKGSVSRIVTTLAQEKFIIRDPDTARYRAGIRLWELGHRYIGNLQVVDVARPTMEEINANTQEDVHLTMMDDEGQIIYLNKIESTRVVRAFVKLGAVHPSYCVAMGKAVLSAMPPEEINSILPAELKAYTETTITDRDELIANLEEARRQGYAVNHGEYRDDLCGVGAPVFDHSGQVIASIGIALPKSRVTDDLLMELGEEVRKGARQISLAMGWIDDTVLSKAQ